MKVHILCTCRKIELLPFSTLVFKTIRVGFPTADIYVTGNALSETVCEAVYYSAEKANARFENGPATIHHTWIESLCKSLTDPFVIVDTDMIFYKEVEDWKFDTALAGWRIPEWNDEFSKCITRARLHTSLLFIKPELVREEITKYLGKITYTPFTPVASLFYPQVIPLNGQSYFYDTCSLLYHAIGGTKFTDQQLNAYFHFNFGVISDIVLPHLSNGESMAKERERILNNPELGCGRWRESEDYFFKRQSQRDTKPLEIPPITPENAKKAREWNHIICKGDTSAMQCNDLAFKYFHALDDFRDEREDGRPKMNDEQILEVFAIAAAFYNCQFYIRNREMLFPIVLNITNSWGDSIMWERSPLKHRRTIANVLSAVGDEFYMAVSLICGGWSHMRAISGKLRERDWLSQHDSDGERI